MNSMLVDDCTLVSCQEWMSSSTVIRRMSSKRSREWSFTYSGLTGSWCDDAADSEEGGESDLDDLDDGFDAAFLDEQPAAAAAAIPMSNLTTPEAPKRSFKVPRSDSVSSVVAVRAHGAAAVAAAAPRRPGKLARCVPCLEERLRDTLARNDEDPELDNVCSEFHRALPHGQTGVDVLKSIYPLISTPASLVAAFMLLERLESKAKKFRLCSANVRSLLFVAVLLVEKCYNDRCKLVNSFARAGGLDPRRLCHLEMTMLVSLNFRLGITRHVFDEYESRLLELGAHQGPSSLLGQSLEKEKTCGSRVCH